MLFTKGESEFLWKVTTTTFCCCSALITSCTSEPYSCCFRSQFLQSRRSATDFAFAFFIYLLYVKIFHNCAVFSRTLIILFNGWWLCLLRINSPCPKESFADWWSTDRRAARSIIDSLSNNLRDSRRQYIRSNHEAPAPSANLPSQTLIIIGEKPLHPLFTLCCHLSVLNTRCYIYLPANFHPSLELILLFLIPFKDVLALLNLIPHPFTYLLTVVDLWVNFFCNLFGLSH